MRKLLIAATLFPILVIGASCASVDRLDAAGDVHALLIAIRDNDQAAFDAHVDKDSLKRQLEAAMIAKTRSANINDGLKAVGMYLANAAADMAGDALLRPQVFHAAANYYGYTPDKPIPGRMAIAGALRPTNGGRVCAKKAKDGPCLMTFALEGGTWRLVSFDDPAMIGLK
jgi:Protein of unknown function (DUF2939)